MVWIRLCFEIQQKFMINKESLIAVTSRTFCRSIELKKNIEKHFKNVKFNDEGIHFDENSLIKFLSGCDAAIISGEKINKKVAHELSNVKVISKFGVGIDNIDIDALEERKIKFYFQPGLNANSVAELTLSYIILLLREANKLNRELLSGSWGKVSSLSRELSESSIGIVGFGQIGRRLEKLLDPHDCQIFVFDPFAKDQYSKRTKTQFLDKIEKLLKKSDVVTLHLPLNDETREIINEEKLKLMKKGSILLNLSRGGLVSEDALYRELIQGKIYAAALDVHNDEPKVNENLLGLNNVFLTPHIAGTSNKSTLDLGNSAIQGLLKYIK